MVALGGDGFLLQTLGAVMVTPRRVFVMNRGTVGFLMNDYRCDGLPERIADAGAETIRPLEMVAETADGAVRTALAINEVSLFRQSYQAAKIRITVDGKVRPGSKTEAFAKAAKMPVHVPLSGRTMEFDAAGACTAGC